jgi:hypothetical protein
MLPWPAWNGLAFGAAPGTLRPDADRPFSRPTGWSHGAVGAASSGFASLRTGRTAALDPAPGAVGTDQPPLPAGERMPPGREQEPTVRLDHIFVRLDLDRWTLTCQRTRQLICRDATRVEAAAALRHHQCTQHQGNA